MARNIIEISKEALTPEFVLRELLEKVDQIEHIGMVYKYKDGSFDLLSSCIDAELTCTFATLMQRRALFDAFCQKGD